MTRRSTTPIAGAPNRGTGRGDHSRSRSRAQAALPALAVAIVILASATVLAVTIADDARTAAERDVASRGLAVTVADILVDPEGPTTRRRTVLDRDATLALSITAIEDAVPAVRDRAIRVRLAGDAIEDWTVEDRTILERGSVRGGTTASRIALLARSETRTDRITVDPEAERALPATARRLTVEARSGNVTTVRVDDRVVLYRPNGIRGSTTIDLPRQGTDRLVLEGTGVVGLRVERERRTPVVITVTVDA
ncbi:hypothetical protein SAMN05192561_101414 [Halopenitus malekzadehii]|uniref:Uncharacterized protein n=1 Tax=Halopenitus malekzadehii TaxID=1267564 RepID=A0A1H6HS64_9EURY|nr:hypothetical protein SAMN05192561_101414 [Halopenitus malekzadehii]